MNLCDEVDGMMTRVYLRWPETYLNVMKEQKHIQFSKHHPDQVTPYKVLDHARSWMTVQVATHQELDEYFLPAINLISEALGDRPPL